MRVKYYITVIVLTSLVLLVGLAGCSRNGGVTTGASANEVNTKTLHVAFEADPSTLDWMYTGASETRDVGWHIFETLFALDKNDQPKPMIAKDYKVNDDETKYTISIRDGVKFHDGSTVTASDVVQSIDRWQKVSSVGKIIKPYIKQVKKKDDQTITIQLKKPYAPFINDIAAPKSSLIIIPKEVAKAAGEEPLTPEQLIGTGPYQFVKWDRGDKIVLKRFDDYKSRDETDWGGLTGEKTADYAKIEFDITKDPQVMLNGVKTGLYDYAENIPPDLSPVVDGAPDIDPVTYINGYVTMTPDKSEAPFNDLNVRKALNMALNKREIAKSVYGDDSFYDFDGALFAPEQEALYTKEGTDNYLAFNQQKAAALLKASDYDGKELKIIYSGDTSEYAKIAQVVKQQLEAVGFSIKLVPYEWATFLDKWEDPANWDLEIVGWSTRFSPSQLGMLIMDTSSSGWYKSKRWGNLLNKWNVTVDDHKKKEILGEMNQTIYDELPFIKFFNIKRLDIKTSKLTNYDKWISMRFWNNQLQK